MRGLQLWRSLGAKSRVVELDTVAVTLLFFQAQFELQTGENTASHTTIAEAIPLAKELNDTHGLASALSRAANLGYLERNPAKVDRFASN
jgi:hypothetical protein